MKQRRDEKAPPTLGGLALARWFTGRLAGSAGGRRVKQLLFHLGLLHILAGFPQQHNAVQYFQGYQPKRRKRQRPLLELISIAGSATHHQVNRGPGSQRPESETSHTEGRAPRTGFPITGEPGINAYFSCKKKSYHLKVIPSDYLTFIFFLYHFQII